jgi:two-component system, chemotaxis family, chemotaxis protein CheY
MYFPKVRSIPMPARGLSQYSVALRVQGRIPVAGINISKLKFLVVEDNPFMKELLRQILRTLGVTQIVEASDGAEGLDLLKGLSADIVLLDWHMEPMDGIEFTKTVRDKGSADRFVPIIMITAYSEIERVTEARDVGVNELLVKPIAATQLFSRIRAVIERPRVFVDCDAYFGPDRRRRADPRYRGEDRRAVANAENKDGAMAQETAA